MSAQIQIATVDGRAVRYLEAGQVGSRALVLVHAFPVGMRLLEPQLGACPGWRVIAPALPGFDGSDRLDDPSIDGYARHVAGLLDALRIDAAVVGGVSMGGHLTFALLRHAPGRVRGVVLADTRSGADTPEALAGRRALLKVASESGSRGVADQMVPKLLGRTTLEQRADTVAAVRTMIESQTPEGIADGIRVLMSRPDSTPMLRDMRVPALVVVGEEDALSPPDEMERLAAAVPDAAFVRIPGAGHLANLEAPAAFNGALQSFLETIRIRM